MKRRIMKNGRTVKLFVFVAAVIIIVFAAGCSGKAGLNVFIWTEYMPDEVFDTFTKETGIKVNVSTYSSNEDMLAKVRSSNLGLYDIVVPTDYMVKIMIAEGLLQPIDFNQIPNFSNIGSGYLNPSFDPGNVYSVPYMAGNVVIVVDRSKVQDAITSFADLANPKYARSIVILDDQRAIIGAAAKSFGYSLNTTSDAELAQVDSLLSQLKGNVRLLDSDSPKSAMLSGETSLGFMWNAEAAICLEESDVFEVIFPQEGCYLFVDNFNILKGAKNTEAAHQFINFVLRPDISKMITEEYPYTNPNAAAIPILPDSYTNNPASNIDPAIFAAGEYVIDLPPADLEKYDAIWTRFTR